jgi:hypothetical protein
LPLGASILAGVVLLALVPTVVRTLAPSKFGSGAQSQLVAHEVQGLSDPFNSKESTAGVHLSLIVDGVKSAFHNPLGQGLSSITIAGAKFGGAVNGNSEADPSNAAIALGLPGLIAYLAVLILAVGRTYRLAARTKTPLALAALGILIVTCPEWLNGGQYAIAFLPWLMMGWVDSATTRRETAAALVADAAPAVVPQAERRPDRARPRPLPLPAATRPFVAPKRELIAAPEWRDPEADAQPRPRRWDVRLLERFANALGTTDPARGQALTYLLYELRPYSTADGLLPLEFDELVRNEFGSGLGRETP